MEKDVPKGFRVGYIVYSENKTVKDLMNLDPVDVDPVVVTKPPNAGVQREFKLSWITSCLLNM